MLAERCQSITCWAFVQKFDLRNMTKMSTLAFKFLRSQSDAICWTNKFMIHGPTFTCIEAPGHFPNPYLWERRRAELISDGNMCILSTLLLLCNVALLCGAESKSLEPLPLCSSVNSALSDFNLDCYCVFKAMFSFRMTRHPSRWNSSHWTSEMSYTGNTIPRHQETCSILCSIKCKFLL